MGNGHCVDPGNRLGNGRNLRYNPGWDVSPNFSGRRYCYHRRARGGAILSACRQRLPYPGLLPPNQLQSYCHQSETDARGCQSLRRFGSRQRTVASLTPMTTFDSARWLNGLKLLKCNDDSTIRWLTQKVSRWESYGRGPS